MALIREFVPSTRTRGIKGLFGSSKNKNKKPQRSCFARDGYTGHSSRKIEMPEKQGDGRLVLLWRD